MLSTYSAVDVRIISTESSVSFVHDTSMVTTSDELLSTRSFTAETGTLAKSNPELLPGLNINLFGFTLSNESSETSISHFVALVKFVPFTFILKIFELAFFTRICSGAVRVILGAFVVDPLELLDVVVPPEELDEEDIEPLELVDDPDVVEELRFTAIFKLFVISTPPSFSTFTIEKLLATEFPFLSLPVIVALPSVIAPLQTIVIVFVVV